MKVFNKFLIVIFLLLSFFFVFKVASSLCKYILSNENTTTIWDGSTAEEFSSGVGSIDNPFVISTPSEFMLIFDSKYNSSNYYFIINNDLYFNKGVFYQDNIFIYDNNYYYLNFNDNSYYSDSDASEQVGRVNIIDKASSFSGHIDGGEHILYGLYVTSDKASLFDNFSGEVNNIRIANSLFWGKDSASFINNGTNLSIHNVIFNGNIMTNTSDEYVSINTDNFNYETGINTIDLDLEDTTYDSLSIGGNFSSDILFNGIYYNGDVEITLDSLSSEFSFDASEGGLFSDISINYYKNSSISSFIANACDTIIDEVIINGNIKSSGTSSGFIGNSYENNIISNSYNLSNITSSVISSTLIGRLYGDATINNYYNSSNITSDVISGGIIGKSFVSSTLSISNCFNSGILNARVKGNFIGVNNTSGIQSSNNYSFDNTSDIGIGNFQVISTFINFSNFLELDNLRVIYDDSIWSLEEGSTPILSIYNYTKPSASIRYGSYLWSDNNYIEYKYLSLFDSFDIDITSSTSDILFIDYYLDNSATNLDYNNIDYSLFKEAKIDKSGTYTLYIKITDAMGNITYINSDCLVINGFDVYIESNNEELGENVLDKLDVVSYTFSGNNYIDKDGYYYLESNSVLPDGTIIELVDFNLNRVYNYTVSGNDYIFMNNKYYYNLSLFKNGSNSYNSLVSGNFNTNITFNLNFSKMQANNFNFVLALTVVRDEDILVDTYSNLLKNISYKSNPLIELSSTNLDVVFKKGNSYNYEFTLDNFTSNDYYLKFYVTSDNNISYDNIVNNFVINYLDSDYYIRSDGYGYIDNLSSDIKVNIRILNNYNIISSSDYYLNFVLCNKYSDSSVSEVFRVKLDALVSYFNGLDSFYVDYPSKARFFDISSLTSYYGDDIDVTITHLGNTLNPKISLMLYRRQGDNFEPIDLCSYISCKSFEIENDKVYLSFGDIVISPNYKKFSLGEYKFVFSLEDNLHTLKRRDISFIVGD